jgi:hypothetical protein
MFLPRRPQGLKKDPIKQFALKGREIAWAKAVRTLPKSHRVFVRQRYDLPLAKINAHQHKVAAGGQQADRILGRVRFDEFRLVTSSQKYGFPVHAGSRRDPGQQRTYRDRLRSGRHCNLQCVRPFDP